MFDFGMIVTNVNLEGMIMPGIICGMNPHDFHERVGTQKLIAENPEAEEIMLLIAEEYKKALMERKYLDSFDVEEIKFLYTVIYNNYKASELIFKLNLADDGIHGYRQGYEMNNLNVHLEAENGMKEMEKNHADLLVNFMTLTQKQETRHKVYNILVRYYSILKREIADKHLS